MLVFWGNARPKLCPELGHCPWWFILLKKIKCSINILCRRWSHQRCPFIVSREKVFYIFYISSRCCLNFENNSVFFFCSKAWILRFLWGFPHKFPDHSLTAPILNFLLMHCKCLCMFFDLFCKRSVHNQSCITVKKKSFNWTHQKDEF